MQFSQILLHIHYISKMAFTLNVMLLLVQTIKLSFACHESIGTVAIQYLSSKRPYHVSDSESENFSKPRCSVEKIWYFGRHGTRYPSKDDIHNINTILPAVKQEIINSQNSDLCNDVVEGIKAWNAHLKSEDAYKLHPQGVSELTGIGERFSSRFHQLFRPPFNNETVFLKTTKSARTEASGKAFTSKIYGDTAWFPPPMKKDPILKYYDACDNWVNHVDNNKTANFHHDLFVNRSIFQNMIYNVSKRIGVRRNLTVVEIQTIYTGCAFETAWTGGKIVSDWCGLFQESDLRILAYANDLEYYYLHGYGNHINYQPACVVLHDLEQFIESNRTVQAYFTHSGAILGVIARLGLFKDNIPIKYDNFYETVHNYMWRSSLIDFMANNIAFVIHKCEDDDMNISLYVNEQPIRFRDCDNETSCNLKTFIQNIQSYTNPCDFEEICR